MIIETDSYSYYGYMMHKTIEPKPFYWFKSRSKSNNFVKDLNGLNN